MTDKLLSALSLCRKAGALTVGFDAVADTLADGRAQLLLFAADLSPATQRRMLARNPGAVPAQVLPYTQQALAAITRRPAGVLAITDPNFGALCQNALNAAPATPI